MKMTTVGTDLAQNVIVVHGVNKRGQTILKKDLKRGEVVPVLLEAWAPRDRYGGLWQHPWVRQIQAMKLTAAQFVKLYVKANKHDAANAEAICEAVARPTMSFVSAQTLGLQAVH